MVSQSFLSKERDEVELHEDVPDLLGGGGAGGGLVAEDLAVGLDQADNEGCGTALIHAKIIEQDSFALRTYVLMLATQPHLKQFWMLVNQFWTCWSLVPLSSQADAEDIRAAMRAL